MNNARCHQLLLFVALGVSIGGVYHPDWFAVLYEERI
jgi:hypothetical protein